MHRRDKSGASERELEKIQRREEEKINHYEMRYSETVHHNKGLRKYIDELRHDKLNAIRRLKKWQQELDVKGHNIVQV